MPLATPHRKWAHSCHERHILAWRFTKTQVEVPDECWLLLASGNCCVIKDLTKGVLQAVAKERERLARSKPKLKLSFRPARLTSVFKSVTPHSQV